MVERVLADKTLSPDVTLAAYGSELVLRCDGVPSTPAVLVLWREITWKSGAPKRGYRLDAGPVIEADRRVWKAVGES